MFFIVSIVCAAHYRQRYHEASQVGERLQTQLQQADLQLRLQQEQQQKVADLDRQLTGELTHEKNNIALLEQRVRLGQRRLPLHARCTGGPENAPTSGVAHAVAPGLTNAAQRDYFSLRRRIALIQAQVKGLQSYIRLLQSTSPPVPEKALSE